MSRILRLVKWITRIVGSLIVLVVLACATYLLWVQPWHQRWGTTQDEIERQLPGDEILPDPSYHCTHAITIHAPLEQVWPWLVQIGQDRGGFYSYAWLENLFGMEIHNADRIVPQWQHLEVGDSVGLAPGNTMELAATEPGRWLVFNMPLARATTWAFILEPIGSKTTRLIIRMRMDAPGTEVRYSPFDPGHFIMERKLMLTIKELAEARAGGKNGYGSTEAIWFVLLIVAGLAILGLVFTKRWPWNLGAASVGVVLWVLAFFRGHPSPLYAALPAASLLAALVWSCPPQRPGRLPDPRP